MFERTDPAYHIEMFVEKCNERAARAAQARVSAASRARVKLTCMVHRLFILILTCNTITNLITVPTLYHNQSSSLNHHPRQKMSYLLRWTRHNQSLVTRSAALVANGNVYETAAALGNIKPLYQIVRTQPIMTPSLSLLSPSTSNKQSPTTPSINSTNHNAPTGTDNKKDDIKYVIKFKELDVKKVFKEFYSLYGPLFVVCHIGIGLLSLGFFCSLTWFAIDLTQVVPDFIVERIGENVAYMTGTGGKFVVAYAIHKIILPVRLGAAIFMTRSLSKFIKKRREA
jgi:hypothetical protein